MKSVSEELPNLGHLTIFPCHVGVISAVSSFHGESLASASLSVGKDCAVVALHHLVSGINKRSQVADSHMAKK